MAVQWGATSGHMQVGIDVRTTAYDWTTYAVDVIVDYYVRTVGWGANDDQTLQPYVNGGAWGGAFGYHINSPSGGTVELYVGSITIGGQVLSYGGGPGYTFQGNVAGSNIGANPSHAISWSLPGKPAGPPTDPGVSISGVTATDAILNVTASDGRGSTVHTYRQEIRRVSDGALIKTWDGGSGYAGPLVRNTAYYGRSMAYNYVGNSGWATTANFTTLSTIPGAPTALAHGLEGPDSIPLTWAAPADNGGQAITGYDMQAAPTGTSFASPITQSVGNVLAGTLTGLTPGLTYDIRVRAKNSLGASVWSAVITGTTLATNRVRVPGVGYVPVRAWGKIPLLGWKPLTVWKRPAGTGGVYRT